MPPYKDSRGRWRFRLQHNDRRYSGSTAKLHNTKAAAKALEKAMLEKLERNAYTGTMPTVRAFVTQFLEHQATCTAQLTRKGQHVHLWQHVVPTLGDKRIDAIGALQIAGLKMKWSAAGAARTTINTRLDTLQRMLSIAAEWGYLMGAPKIKRLPKDDEPISVRFLSDAEGARLVAAADPKWASMILIGLRTGLRVGELRGLQWGDVNFTTRSIRVHRTDPGRRDMKANSPKSGKGRTVPMTSDAFACLQEMARAAHPCADGTWLWPALPWRGKKRKGARSASGCFHGIIAAAEAAGLKDVGWHTLRHSYASALMMRGVGITVVQELLGHAEIKQTMVYAHLAPGFAHHAAVAALDTPLLSFSNQQALSSGKSDDESSNGSGSSGS